MTKIADLPELADLPQGVSKLNLKQREYVRKTLSIAPKWAVLDVDDVTFTMSRDQARRVFKAHTKPKTILSFEGEEHELK